MDGWFTLERGELEVTARAPGHGFVARGPCVSVRARFEGGVLREVEAHADLSRLVGGDPLATHEIRKFLKADEAGGVRAELAEGSSCVVSDGRARGSVPLKIVGPNARRSVISASVAGPLERIEVSFPASFSMFGYSPPKLLVFRVKDELGVVVRGPFRPSA